nr:alpha/beta fold hydrolase [Roseibacterium persicicum]
MTRILLVLVILGGLMAGLGPREPAVRTPGAAPGQTADPAVLAAREAALPDIVPGAEARVVWAGEAGAVTPWSVLYLHGFSASSEEIRPVPDRVAAALGANLVFARLPGHGRSAEAMAEATAGDWLDDTDLMLDVARAVGERVLVIGTSTGGTLAAWAATEPDMADRIAGVVLVSPNFAVADPAGVLLEWPFAAVFVPWIVGPERGFEPLNEAQATYWTERYPSIATVRLGALLRELRGRDLGTAGMPVLVLFSEADSVVSVAATRAAAARWGGPVTLAPQVLPGTGVDPSAHVIAGDIVSPAMTGPVTDAILGWVAELPR